MPRHESVTYEYVAELRAGLLAGAERVKAAPNWPQNTEASGHLHLSVPGRAGSRRSRLAAGRNRPRAGGKNDHRKTDGSDQCDRGREARRDLKVLSIRQGLACLSPKQSVFPPR